MDEKDIQAETYGEAGVRLTHVPTGIVIDENSTRSRGSNRAEAMERLKVSVGIRDLIAPDAAPAMETFKEEMAKALFGRSRKDPACVVCGSNNVEPKHFKDKLSRKEFGISRMCQACQDFTFSGEG